MIKLPELGEHIFYLHQVTSKALMIIKLLRGSSFYMFFEDLMAVSPYVWYMVLTIVDKLIWEEEAVKQAYGDALVTRFDFLEVILLLKNIKTIVISSQKQETWTKTKPDNLVTL